MIFVNCGCRTLFKYSNMEFPSVVFVRVASEHRKLHHWKYFYVYLISRHMDRRVGCAFHVFNLNLKPLCQPSKGQQPKNDPQMWESDLPDAGRKVNLICKHREWFMFRVDGSVTSRRWTRKWRRKLIITSFNFHAIISTTLVLIETRLSRTKLRLLSINHHHKFGLLTKKKPITLVHGLR